jgi:hypothetical protein
MAKAANNLVKSATPLAHLDKFLNQGVKNTRTKRKLNPIKKNTTLPI